MEGHGQQLPVAPDSVQVELTANVALAKVVSEGCLVVGVKNRRHHLLQVIFVEKLGWKLQVALGHAQVESTENVGLVKCAMEGLLVVDKELRLEIIGQ